MTNTPTGPTPPIDTIGSHIGNGGQFDPTDPALRLAWDKAEEIANELWAKYDEPAPQMIVEAVFAGILRASELAAQHLNTKHGMPTHDYEPGYSDIAALRQFEHLKGWGDEAL